MIVANNVSAEGAGFGTDTNIVSIYKRDNTSIKLPLMSKRDVAKRILEEAYHFISEDADAQ
jgi:phosphopantothenoylcysteine decarboxylase/phosphopantothenate--cysteine ligase